MKQLFVFYSLLLLPFWAHAQVDSTAKWRLDIAAGSFHNKYFYPITDLRFVKPVFNKKLQADFRLRSYGILSIFSHRAYDLDAIANYNFFLEKQLQAYAGAGGELSLRLVNDGRSTARSGVEFVLNGGMKKELGKWSFDLPVYGIFYGDGWNFSVRPEMSYRIFKRSAFFLRYENNMLYYYSGIAHEWHFDSFIGIRIRR